MNTRLRGVRGLVLALFTLIISGAILASPVLAEGTTWETDGGLAALLRRRGARVPALIQQVPDEASLGAIEGIVYQDWNQNGVHDIGEPTLAGATVSLLVQDGGDEGYWAKVRHVVTGGDGRFHFGALDPAHTYYVVATAPLGYSALAPTEAMVQPVAGETTTLSFGYVLLLRPPNPDLLP